MEKNVKIVGIGDDGRTGLPPLYAEWIERCELLVGGERQLGFFPEYAGEKMAIRGGLAELASKLRSEKRRTVVLASGDPLFYGIGGYLASKLDADVYPSLSSVQLAFARMGESWQDAYLTSVHGRDMKGLAQRIDGKEKVALLTDQANDPAAIARYLLSFGMREYRAFVAENLGGAEEKTGWYDLEELQDGQFSPLNVVILRKQGDSPFWPLGIPDHQFAQRKPDKGLITKREVRVLSLARLQLKPDSTVWDIGTCTGSVAIEAAKLARDGAVFGIEKNEGDLQNALENMRKFRADITFVHGKAPQGLERFPDPDAVFIGGSGGELRELLQQCCGRLKPGGRIVLNASTIETLYEATRAMAEEGFETDVTLLQAARSKPILDMTRFEGLNPVYIVTAWRKEESGEEEENGSD
ncbi:precorrin-6y C5,15-methyltransferase (decarboxylating) subunit CbiE [Cohnella sp. CFH 77786]|uniref:precorrin-6y C5,15-methyltransferase (decarboxylating) subunit CbiE n=1 Tax=Cohnella sp. CFH 77786 TaxID=2662265 RepID=UPI001C60A384|nr:precorrin-6y C5,15-methyltransferase (decarboxylating) subunit CbiE [Cohnella sp. CFH 77786]